MKKWFFLLAMLAGMLTCMAQKKPLDHSVYDSWQSIGKTIISNNGQWVAYTITVQEGDDELVVQSTVNNSKTIVPRGYEPAFTSDNATIVFKIKPLFKHIRNAKIKKKKADEMPRDSFALMTLATRKIEKYPNLISLKAPKEPNIWVAGLFKNEQVVRPKYQSDKTKDSLKQIIDSLQYVIGSLAPAKGEGKDSITDPGRNNKLLLFNTATGTSLTFKNVSEYIFNKKGTELLLEQTLDLKDTARTSRIILYHLLTKKTDTLLRGGNDFKSLALSDDGRQAAFVAQRGAKAKALTKYYTLWHFKQGMDSARVLVDTLTPNFRSGERISEYGKVSFSRSGERLQFATGPARLPKDTGLVDIDKVNVDIWNYKDDYLQPYQLQNQKREREKSYVAVYDFKLQRMMPVGNNNL
ncbi:MAG TPA: hypothetical protein VL943_06410, partial [Niabella sp.]|nr:hypothetical protein [Niabella sp.]